MNSRLKNQKPIWEIKLKINKVIRKIAKALETEDKIIFAVLFGSVAKGLMTKLSDFDIAIYSKEKLSNEEIMNLIYAIASELNINEERVDLVILDRYSPYELRFKVFRDGLPIIIRDLEVYKKYRDESISFYLDFKVFKKKLNLDKRYIEKLKGSLDG